MATLAQGSLQTDRSVYYRRSGAAGTFQPRTVAEIGLKRPICDSPIRLLERTPRDRCADCGAPIPFCVACGPSSGCDAGVCLPCCITAGADPFWADQIEVGR